MRDRVDHDDGQVREDDRYERRVETVHGAAPRPGNPPAFHAATISSSPSTKAGYMRAQRKSPRSRSVDVGKDVARRSAVYRPRKRRARDRGSRRGGLVPSLCASSWRNADRETGRSSTTCQTPDLGHSAAATKALAASSEWIKDQRARPPSTRIGLPRARESARIRVCHPSAE